MRWRGSDAGCAIIVLAQWRGNAVFGVVVGHTMSLGFRTLDGKRNSVKHDTCRSPGRRAGPRRARRVYTPAGRFPPLDCSLRCAYALRTCSFYFVTVVRADG
ncbi:hypothetical protein EVAR_66657_1 [Eumeta japonica]|uniref:Uncharacterized protein n=1 Tax=Eumeta variegata TaxID=151549 RepID=A0A4C1ZDW3_EUMVA|nr:hypothetical protein EVAR_66657_1 [Eumeta japonica]